MATWVAWRILHTDSSRSARAEKANVANVFKVDWMFTEEASKLKLMWKKRVKAARVSIDRAWRFSKDRQRFNEFTKVGRSRLPAHIWYAQCKYWNHSQDLSARPQTKGCMQDMVAAGCYNLNHFT